MKEITNLQEIKRIELDILTAVDIFCSLHSIQYYLSYGTLLGAQRHGGFIPWDDDIDIMMPRDDYSRFVEVFKHEYYEVHSLNDPSYFYPFAKVCDNRTKLVENTFIHSPMGIYIDVFPIDGVSLNIKEREKQHRYLAFLNRLLKHKYSPFNRKRTLIKKLFLPIVKLFLLPWDCNDISKKMEMYAQRNSFHSSEIVGCVIEDSEREDYFFPKEWLGSNNKLLFEGIPFIVPQNTVSYLKLLYGDYMKLPPVNERVGKHSYKAYWK